MESEVVRGGVRVDPHPQRGSAELYGGSTTSCGGSNPLTPPPVKYSPGDNTIQIMHNKECTSIWGARTALMQICAILAEAVHAVMMLIPQYIRVKSTHSSLKHRLYSSEIAAVHTVA